MEIGLDDLDYMNITVLAHRKVGDHLSTGAELKLAGPLRGTSPSCVGYGGHFTPVLGPRH